MFAIHVVTYVSVSLLATFAWALMAGSLPQGPEFLTFMRNMFVDPALRDQNQFWPYWIWTVWGGVVLAHLVLSVLAPLASSDRRRTRRIVRRSRGLSGNRPLAAEPVAARTASPVVPRPAEPVIPRPSAREAPAGSSVPPHVPEAAEPGRRARDEVRVALLRAYVDATLRTDNDITDADWGRMMRGYRRMFATAAASFDGTVLDAGDEGFHARFDDPTQAVRCALHLQRELDHLRQAAGVAPALRIGLHAGATDAGAGALDLALAPDGTIRSGEIVATTSLEPYVLGASAVPRRGETDLLSIHPQSTGS